MAKIKFGMMMTDARGKLGGQVFSKNRSGAYVRTKVTPVNPQTTFQQSNRSLLGSLSSGWSNLTQVQRNSWNSAVEAWQKTNVFGDLQKPTGKNLFTGLNKVRSANFPESAMLVLPPAKEEFNVVVIASASYIVGSGAFTVTMSGAFTEGATFEVRATGNISAGTSYIKNLLRGLGNAFVVSPEGVLTITSAYQTRFGSLSNGSKVGIEVREVRENGQFGVPSTFLLSIG